MKIPLVNIRLLRRIRQTLVWLTLALVYNYEVKGGELQQVSQRLEQIDNGIVRIGIDLNRGGSITHLSWKAYTNNAVNIHDPGRLIQQSYYVGKRLDRTADGQSKHWSPWAWNPIQGGGVGSWARIQDFKRSETSLTCTTIPKLWDMPDEEAAAVLLQNTAFEAGFNDVIVIKNKLLCSRVPQDRWGPAVARSQELPALYFTRNFHVMKTYMGKGAWQTETIKPGPPWGQRKPPLNAMAFFNEEGQGIGIYSPAANKAWNLGPHGNGASNDPLAGPCMHVAPIARIQLGPQSTFSYRYWIITGTQANISIRLDALINEYAEQNNMKLSPAIDAK